MAVSNVSAPAPFAPSTTRTASSAATASSPAGSSSASLTQDQFLQLLTTQIQNQDPLNPMSDTDFTTQLAQLSMLSGIQQLNSNFQQMLLMQQLSQGAALVGKTVVYAQSGSQLTGTGTVDAVSLDGGKLQVRVGGKTVPAEQIRGIAAAGNKS